MARKPQVPTLADLLIELGADARRVRNLAKDFYDGVFGEYAIEAGVATREQVARALAKQAALRGDHRAALEHIDSIGAFAHSLAMAWARGKA